MHCRRLGFALALVLSFAIGCKSDTDSSRTRAESRLESFAEAERKKMERANQKLRESEPTCRIDPPNFEVLVDLEGVHYSRERDRPIAARMRLFCREGGCTYHEVDQTPFATGPTEVARQDSLSDARDLLRRRMAVTADYTPARREEVQEALDDHLEALGDMAAFDGEYAPPIFVSLSGQGAVVIRDVAGLGIMRGECPGPAQ